jgi:hypothetical protein
MDGAITELGYGRSAELKAEAERHGWCYAWRLVDWLAAQSRGYFRHVEHELRGLPAHASDWPAWCWDRFCDSPESSDITERDLLVMREPFLAEAALRLDVAGYDCR